MPDPWDDPAQLAATMQQPGMRARLANSALGMPVGAPNALMAGNQSDYSNDTTAIGEQYPVLKPYLKSMVVQEGKTTGPADDRQLEFYQPWDTDNPNPGKMTSELFDPVKNMSATDRQETIAGDMLHHLGTIDPSTGKPVDPIWYGLKQELGEARTDFHLKIDKNAYAQEKANPSYETGSYDEWDRNNRLDAYVRAGVFPKQNKEWNEPEGGEERGFVDNPKMQEIYGRMRNYLRGKGVQ